MTGSNLKELTAGVVQVCRDVDLFLKAEAGGLRQRDIESKGLHDYVTRVDKTSERMLVDALGRLLPGSSFLAEEGSGTRSGSGYTWVIDPLDGTTNYIHGVPVYCISVALSHEGRTLSGVVLEGGRGECFYAWKGGGAWLDGSPVRVSTTERLHDSLLATGFPYYDYGRLEGYLDLFAHFMRNTRGLRRLGSAAADLAYVAAGRFDGFYEYGLHPWDVAAGLLLVEEAGGRNSDFQGNSEELDGSEIVSANPVIFDEMLRDVSSYMHRD